MKIRAKAYAKLNFFLDVLAKRDDGYHDINSVMQSISLHNVIEVSDNDSGKITITYSDPALSRPDDIMYKACEVFFAFSGWKSGLDIYIKHNIPTVAGLGGFSTSVATLLKILNIISKKNYTEETMNTLCRNLGADVPFCYNGGTARATGIGDKLQYLPTVNFNLVLIKEGEKQSTGEMYANLDGLKLPPSDKISDMLSGLEQNNAIKVLASTYNIFENCWNFDKMKEPFTSFFPDAIFLSGSGPTVVAAFVDKKRAEECYNILRNEGRNVYIAECVDYGNIIE